MDGIDQEAIEQLQTHVQNNATMGISLIVRIVKMETLLIMMDAVQIE